MQWNRGKHTNSLNKNEEETASIGVKKIPVCDWKRFQLAPGSPLLSLVQRCRSRDDSRDPGSSRTAWRFNDVQSLRCTLASVLQQCPNSHITKNTSVAAWISPFRWACSQPLWGLQVLLCSGAYTSITLSKTSPMTRKDVTSECETPVFISPHLQHDLYLKHFTVIASSCS